MPRETVKLCARCAKLAADGYDLQKARAPERPAICGLCRRRTDCGEYFALPRKAARKGGGSDGQNG